MTYEKDSLTSYPGQKKNTQQKAKCLILIKSHIQKNMAKVLS
ncbi:hypothetical protein [Gemella sp. zg-1178]|nr:hypothetical protein [Gemella sp. zg-1178]